MNRRSRAFRALVHLSLASIVAACASEGGSRNPPEECTTRVKPSSDDQTTVQTALIEAVPGSVICFDNGRYEFTDELSLSVDDVKVRGTFGGAIFDFEDQVTGANGFSATGDNFEMESLTILDTPGDGVRVTGATGVTFRDVTVRWTAGSVTSNGAYGLYPVSSTGVLIEDCEVSGASDAGIYVGQSTDVIVRNNRAHGNVAGIEIENTTNAEVHDNHVYDNTGGILVFNLPELPVKGQRALVHNNDIDGNNHANFAEEGTVVANVPPGTGLMIMSKDMVEARNNDIHDNDSAAVLIISYIAVDSTWNDPDYDAYPETLFLHDNTYTNNGTDPQGILDQLAAIAGVDVLEQILWDGFVDVAKVNTNGSLSICLQDGVSFRNFVLASNLVGTNTDLTPHDCTHPTLPPVTL